MSLRLPLSSLLSLFLLCLASRVNGADNGMDMSMDGAMALTMGQMLPYLHFTPGDMLWFMGWTPISSGAMVGTCIAFVLLGILERWIAASKAVMHAHWLHRAQVVRANKVNSRELPVSSLPDYKQTSLTRAVIDNAITFRTAPPFMLWNDLARGVLHAGHAALQYALMLAVM
ncbi:hypothetical protein EIP86_009031 [Pleurotus ostreatoroseus]|nr:hypothetical protein EIP86_009031 [Pleurotus ostreatoroseus]